MRYKFYSVTPAQGLPQRREGRESSKRHSWIPAPRSRLRTGFAGMTIKEGCPRKKAGKEDDQGTYCR